MISSPHVPPSPLARSATATSVGALWVKHGPDVTSWLTKGVAPLTHKGYSSKVKEWTAFAIKYNLLDDDLFTRATYSLSRQALTLFIYELKTTQARSSDFIKRALQALRNDLIKKLFDVTVFADPSILLARRSSTESARDRHKARLSRQRLPVTFDIISWLSHHLSSTGVLDDEMTLSGILLSFNFMLRCSEYCHNPDAPHAVLCRDVTFKTLSGSSLSPLEFRKCMSHSFSEISDIIIDVCSSKGGSGRRLTLSRANGPSDSGFIDSLCGFTVRAGHLSLDDPFLSRYLHNRRKKLHRGMVNDALKLAARHFGIDEFYFSTHSLRIGGATCGAAGGRSRSSLCRTGGWSELSASDALYRHTTPQDRGILSLTDEDAHLLTVRDLQSMVPSLSQRPRA